MNDRWSVDIARSGDGETVGRLFRAVPPAELQGMTIWDSPLFWRYFEDMLERRSDRAAPSVFVLRSAAGVGGAISVRSIGGELVLDNANVHPSLRARLLGIRLMVEAIEARLATAPSGFIASDVFAGRTALEKFHRSIGGIEQGQRGWWTNSLQGLSHKHPQGEVHGLAEADLQHDRWGFSSIGIQTSSGDYQVGRLPGPYFRLTDPAGVSDGELIRTLASLDPARELFLMGPLESPGQEWTRVAALRRFRARSETLLSALKRCLVPAGSEPRGEQETNVERANASQDFSN